MFKKDYRRRPKTGRPVFGVFEKRPVVKHSGFQTLSTNRTKTSGYRTSGSFQSHPPAIGRPVPIPFNRTSDSRNRFQTGLEPVLVDSDNWNQFQTGFGSKSRQYCPDFRRLRYSKRLKTGYNVRLSDVRFISIVQTGRPIT